ncbi:MAG: bifunctional acetaldehyde-CoA/alcohol dehydrogenase [Lentisphaeria bacterium]|nr:bifunctional acetaldehyde-CoA/alcohol dehydrogenase [Lentisphaeria bacterium]MBO5765667.1 bifunctional acetaldehyde-CoA/alcohol dehydrogenase [Lentisphaeria bacterium]
MDKKKAQVSEITPEEKAAAEKALIDGLVSRVKAAQEIFANYSQEQVDKIFRAAALAANNMRIPLAQMAVEETGMGVVEDKIIKNHYASEYICNKYLPLKTCGIIETDDASGIIKVAEPRGVIAGIVPTTNPTSTAIFKSLIALKTRNGIVFSPHPRAKKCTCLAAKIVLDAAVKAGAPADIIAWIDDPTVAMSGMLMSHDDVSLILATGGPGMVKAAYSSGTPAVGVGPGNTPVIFDDTCDIEMAVSSVLLSKTFDNGMICASEQSVTVLEPIYEQVKKEFVKRGGYILNKKEAEAVGNTIQVDGKLNAAIVGQTAVTIAKLAGIEVPPQTKVLIAEVSGVGIDVPFSREKLSPTLALYKAATYEEAIENGKALLNYGGLGHTAVLYTNTQNEERIREFGHIMLASRVLINTPSSQGGIGDLYNFALNPSLTLGCGSWGGNYVAENVGPKNLLNIKSIAKRRENMLWFQIPQKMYFKYGCLCTAIGDLAGKKRAFIVTDKFLYNSGVLAPMLQTLTDMGIATHVFSDVTPDPTIQLARRGLEQLNSFDADVIIAVGGGSPIDAAKIMWLMYEQPEVSFEDIAMRFMDIRKRIVKLPPLGKRAMMVAVPTTSGTGSEVTPFAVITDEETQQKFPIADYALTPNMAIIDTELVMKLPKGLTAISGIDALTHALEARVSCMQSDYCNALANEALNLIFKYLPECYHNGNMNEIAREHMFNASAMAGMAFANAFLGLCHSMAHKLGGMYHVPHGLANAFLISHIIRFNAVDCMTKQAAFPQYHYPNAKADYAAVARYIGIAGKDDDESVANLIDKIEELKRSLDIPAAMKPWFDAKGISEETFLKQLDELSVKAFDDQCTGANPRYPLISEIKEIYLAAYYGK